MRVTTVGLCLTTLILSACGGGGSSATTVENSLQLSGTAATGLAISDAPVQAKCSKGSASGRTTSQGDFHLEVENGELPCVVEVVQAERNIRVIFRRR